MEGKGEKEKIAKKTEMAENAFQLMLSHWLKKRLNELVRDLGPMTKATGLDSKETREFIFGQIEQAIALLKKGD